jgi:tetratricopeptide (TPR) repeat protein
MHMQRAVELRPDEPNPYDFLGDVHRAQGQLEKAREDYTMAAQRAPDDASPIQQRGHVNSFLGNYDAARADYQKSMDMARSNQSPSFAVYKAFVNLHADNAQAAIDELTALTAQIDQMDVPGRPGLKAFALNNAIQIALHHGLNDQAASLIAEWAVIMRQQAEQAGTDPARRGQEAAIAYWEGRLAANRKDFATASQKADAIATLLEPDANPRKLEPVHELRGFIALGQGNAAEAVAHFRQGNPTTTYTTYMLAVALEAAGQTDEARRTYNDVATNYFNSVDFALTRKAAQSKANPQS